jgi:4-hydroxy-3-polyprenylbenzoate decarboxylase
MQNNFKDFRQLLAYIEKRGLLRRVRTSVSPDFELAAVTHRAAKLPGGGPALLFENVAGGRFPILTNLLGSAQRLAWALNVNRLDELSGEMGLLLSPPDPSNLGEKLARLGETSYLTRYTPRLVRSGACQEASEDGELSQILPFLQSFEGEGGRALRSVLLFTPDGIFAGDLVATPDGYVVGARNLPPKNTPVAVVIGGETTLQFAVRAPYLPQLDPLVLASSLARNRLEMVRCRTSELQVSASAEFVLEGTLTAMPMLNIPLAQSNGALLPLPNPAVFKPTVVTRRKDALLLTSITGTPPHEELVLVKGSERLLLPILQAGAPEITALTFPLAGSLHDFLIVAIKKSYAGQAQKVMYGIWGQEKLRLIKNILVVDADCNIHDPAEVATRALSLLEPSRDLLTVPGALHPHDFGGSPVGTKLGLDATRKLPGEADRPAPPVVALNAATLKIVAEKWHEYGIEG